MGDKRMLSQKIVESDAFLDMPLSAQALYMHLVMTADDDGFVNSAKRIQRACGASPEDLKELIERRFLLTFPSGVVVIKHWGVANKVREDRKKPTSYSEELATLYIREDGAYTTTADKSRTNRGQNAADCPQNDSVSKVKLSKDNYTRGRARKNAFNDFPQRHYTSEELDNMEKIRRTL